METVIFIVIVLLLLIPEFLHGWSDGGYSCTRRRIDGGECHRHDHGNR
jgi:hypothetical protein